MARKILLSFLAVVILSWHVPSHAAQYAYIDSLFDVRGAITNQGKVLPELIKKSRGNDLRTLERIFELNTSAITTIEAYFRVFKIAVVVKGNLNKESLDIMNEWLDFIRNQCKYDKQYLTETLKTTKNKTVIGQLQKAIENIEKLAIVTEKGINENNDAFKVTAAGQNPS